MFKHFQTFISSRTILSFALSGKCCVKHIGKGPPTWYILLVHYSVHWWILTTFVFSSLVDICFLKNFADHQSSCTCLLYKCTSIWPLCAPSQCVILITVFPELTPYYSPWVDPPPPQPFLLWWPLLLTLSWPSSTTTLPPVMTHSAIPWTCKRNWGTW